MVRATRPKAKGNREFPLTLRKDGRWSKKYKGRVYTFSGSRKAALAAWRAKEKFLTTGAFKTSHEGLTTAEPQVVTTKKLSEIIPSPENEEIYLPVTAESVADLVEDVKREGILNPIIITLDGYIISGHRRCLAATLAGLTEVPVIVHQIYRTDDIDGFVRLLITHNNQRVKTFAEKLHEEAAKIDPAQAYRRLITERAERSVVSLSPLSLGVRRARSKISEAKRPMLDAVLREIRNYGKPISDRKLVYLLMNNPPLKNANDQNSGFVNDRKSYNNLCNLITRARLEGIIPWEAIIDETRPVQVWNVWRDTQPFIKSHFDKFLQGYWRDLLQSQPNHIEILVEKNTVAADVQSIAANYTVPMTSGRGFCSIGPRHDMAVRFHKSGKAKLILLIVSDLDPAGMAIAESFANSMQDDFGLNVHAIKVGITFEQVQKYKLPHGEKAKKGRGEKKDGLRREFVSRYGEYVYEVEALPKGELEILLDEAIRGVLDLEAYNHEVDQEAKDSVNIEAAQAAAREMLKGINLESDDGR